ncbi:MAG: beta-galactosidase [Lentisphaeria bacterium]|nr:beta-galactosidase [Lentisphaeria bacterium]
MTSACRRNRNRQTRACGEAGLLGLFSCGLLVAAGTLLAQASPVQVETYLTGAWFAPADEAQREMYLKGGFTMVPHSLPSADWAAEQGLAFIAGVSSSGLPGDVARPFEDASGAQSMSVGLFTHINFNAPSVRRWWQTRVPEQVRATPHAERVRFWKVHNEFGYHAAGIYDYSPGTLDQYRAWLSTRYASVADLNTAWNTAYAGFEDVDPPRTPEQMRQHLANWLEWRRFTCWNFADYFRTTGDLIRGVVPAAAVSDNFYTTSPLQGWDNFELARQTDYLAYDIYAARRWPRLLATLEHARCSAAAWGKPFLLMEYHAGPNHWITEMTHDDILIEAFAALARECRAIQWFRWVPGGEGREQGIHGMMDSRGHPTERFTAVAEVSAFCQRLAPLLHRTRTVAPIALLTGSDAAYLAYARHTAPAAGRWDNLAALLSAAGLPCDQIDPTVLVEGDLKRYRVILAGHVEVLADEALARLRRFAEEGGTVVLHPDTALLDGYGHPRQEGPYTAETVPDGPWPARKRRSGESASVTVEPLGKGRLLHCAWELPARQAEGAAFAAMSTTYAAMLADHAGLRPLWQAEGNTQPENLDVRLLDTGMGHLLVATWLGDEGTAFSFTLPQIPTPARAYLLTATGAAVQPLTTRLGASGLTLSPVRLDPAACILIADKPWQPLLGIEAPKILHPGQSAAVTVTIDNLDSQTVAGNVALSAPPGWTVEAFNGMAFPGLAPGGRTSARFRVTVPADAVIDPFAIDHPLLASATFTTGRSGRLQVRHLPYVMPALDVRVFYEDACLNPWQELTPPLLRWGWDNEVRIPPPPPLSAGAPCPVNLLVRVTPDWTGRALSLSVVGPGAPSVSPASLTLSSPSQRLPAVLSLPGTGSYILRAACGETSVEVHLQAGVHTQTVAAAAERPPSPLPPGWRLLGTIGVGVRAAPAAGLPVTVHLPGPIETPERVRVLDAAGAAVAACGGGAAVTLAADLAEDSATAYTLVLPPAAQTPPEIPRRVRIEERGAGETLVHGETYSLSFDTHLGLLRWLEIAGKRCLPHRSGVVATVADAGEWAPDATVRLEGFALAATPVGAEISLTRRQRDLAIEETWRLQARRIDVSVRVKLVARAPVTLTTLSYEIGADPQALPLWRRRSSAGWEAPTPLPAAMGPSRHHRAFDLCHADGSGLALRLDRCALMTKWQSGFGGLHHDAYRTEIALFRGLRLDPGDTVLAEFVLFPHGPRADGPPPLATEDPVAVTAWKTAP